MFQTRYPSTHFTHQDQDLPKTRPNLFIPESMLPYRPPLDAGHAQIECDNGMTVVWTQDQWRTPEFAGGPIRTRNCEGSIYRNRKLVGALHFEELQVRQAMSVANFFQVCDETSVQCAKQANAIANLLLKMERRRTVQANECFVELEGIVIDASVRGQRVWVEPIRRLLDQVYTRAQGYTVLMGHPYPIEYCLDDVVDDDPRLDKSPHFTSRLIAMIRSYSHYFGLDIVWAPTAANVWMAKHLA